MRRIATVAGHELRTQLRGASFWTLVAVVVLVTATLNPVAMVPSGDVAVEGVRAFVDSPHALAQTFALGGLFAYPFLVALMAGLILVREEERAIGDLIHSTPLTTGEYLLGKLLGAGGALALVLVLHVAAVVVLHGMGHGESPVHGAFHAGQMVLQALVFLVPGVGFTALVAFAVGARTRSALAVYAVPTVLFTLVVTVLWTWSPPPGAAWGPGVDRLLTMLDPSGLRWLSRTAFAVDRGNAYFNRAAVPFDGTLLLNRLLTLVGPALLAAWAARRFRPLPEEAAGGRRRRTQPVPAQPPPAPARPTSLRELAMASRGPTRWTAALTLLRCELRELRRQPMVYLFLGFLALVVAEAAATGPDLYGTPLRLTAGTLAVRTLPVMTLLGCLFLLFTTVESMHRERATGFEALLHSAPISNGAILLGKGLAGGVLTGLLSLTGIATGAALLLLKEDGRLEMAPLAWVFGPVLVPTFLLWIAFVTAAASILRHRQASLAVGLGALVLTGFWYARGSMTWVTNWPLWSALRWSDMGVFPLHGEALLLNRLAAVAGAVFLFAVSLHHFPRSEGDRLRTGRLAGGIGGALRLAPFALLPLLVTGFLAIQVRTGFQGEARADHYREYHLSNSATWGALPPPRIEAVDLRLDLEPERRWMEVEGRYRLTNPGDRLLRWLPFTVTPSLGAVRWRLDGRPVEALDSAGLHLLEPERPLPPGAEATVEFAYEMTYPRGVSRNGGAVSSFIVPAGVSLSTHRGELLPRPGYVDGLGRPASEAPRPARFPDGSAPATEGADHGDAFVSRMEITVPSQYRVSATGDRIAERTGDGRTTTVWHSDTPVHTLSLQAGRWRERRRDRAVVLYHPGHGDHVELFLDTLASAVDHYSAWFGSYPWSELRLAEIPDLETQATAYPGHIAFSEALGFLAGGSGPAPLPFSVAAHEAAHQWWGHRVTAGDGPGDGWLIEGMANYSALLLHRAVRGEASRIAFARQLERIYLERRRSGERPVLQALEGEIGEELVLSHRGAWLLWMLQERVGEKAMLEVLGGLAREHAASGRPLTPGALLKALETKASDRMAFRTFVRQWLEGTALPEYRIEDATRTRTATGWHTTATVTNAGTGTAGVEVVALGADGERQAATDGRLPLELPAGAPARVAWETDFPPLRLVVDPDVRVLQLNRDKAVAEPGAEGTD